MGHLAGRVEIYQRLKALMKSQLLQKYLDLLDLQSFCLDEKICFQLVCHIFMSRIFLFLTIILLSST